MINNRLSFLFGCRIFRLLEQRIHPTYQKKATSQRCSRTSTMTTLEIDCTMRTKQKSTLSVENLCQTRVRMLRPMLVPSVNSLVHTVIGTWKLRSLAAAREVHWETQYGPLAQVHDSPCHAFAILREFAFIPQSLQSFETAQVPRL